MTFCERSPGIFEGLPRRPGGGLNKSLDNYSLYVTYSKRLGMKLKRLRLAKEWSQERLAKKARISRVYLGQLEAGAKSPTVRTLQRLARALGVKVTELVE